VTRTGETGARAVFPCAPVFTSGSATRTGSLRQRPSASQSLSAQCTSSCARGRPPSRNEATDSRATGRVPPLRTVVSTPATPRPGGAAQPRGHGDPGPRIRGVDFEHRPDALGTRVVRADTAGARRPGSRRAAMADGPRPTSVATRSANGSCGSPNGSAVPNRDIYTRPLPSSRHSTSGSASSIRSGQRSRIAGTSAVPGDVLGSVTATPSRLVRGRADVIVHNLAVAVLDRSGRVAGRPAARAGWFQNGRNRCR